MSRGNTRYQVSISISGSLSDTYPFADCCSSVYAASIRWSSEEIESSRVLCICQGSVLGKISERETGVLSTNQYVFTNCLSQVQPIHQVRFGNTMHYYNKGTGKVQRRGLVNLHLIYARRMDGAHARSSQM